MKYLRTYENVHLEDCDEYDTLVDAGYYIESHLTSNDFFDWELNDIDSGQYDREIYYYFCYNDDIVEDIIEKITKSLEKLNISEYDIKDGLHSMVDKNVKNQTIFELRININIVKKFSKLYQEFKKYNL